MSSRMSVLGVCCLLALMAHNANAVRRDRRQAEAHTTAPPPATLKPPTITTTKPETKPPTSHVNVSVSPKPETKPPQSYATVSVSPKPETKPPQSHVNVSVSPKPETNSPQPHVNVSVSPKPETKPPQSYATVSVSPKQETDPPRSYTTVFISPGGEEERSSPVPSTTVDPNILIQHRIDAICALCSFPDRLTDGFMAVKRCSRQYYQCTKGVNGFSLILRTCPTGTLWDNNIYNCVSPLQSSYNCTRVGGSAQGGCNRTHFKHPLFCNMYQQCLHGGQIIQRCCPPGTVWLEDSQTCGHNMGEQCPQNATCNVARSNTSMPTTTTTTTTDATTPVPTTVATQGVCKRFKLPFMIGDSNSCDRYTFCAWITPTQTFHCCSPGLVWNQALYTCVHPTEEDDGCIKLCVTDIPEECMGDKLRICLLLSEDFKDQSRSRFAVVRNNVELEDVELEEEDEEGEEKGKAAVFAKHDSFIKIPGFKNLWNGQEPRQLTYMIDFMKPVSENGDVFENGHYNDFLFLLGNGDCRYFPTFGVFLQPAATSENVKMYHVIAAVHNVQNLVFSQQPVAAGEWHSIHVTYDGDRGLLELYVDGDYTASQVVTGPVKNSKSALYVGRQFCDEEVVEELHIRKVLLYEKVVSPEEGPQTGEGEGFQQVF